MQFKLVPILDKMEALYSLPRTRERFNAYLLMLQGPRKNEMILPIAGYNPMGAELIPNKIRELKSLRAESLIEEELQKINQQINDKTNLNQQSRAIPTLTDCPDAPQALLRLQHLA